MAARRFDGPTVVLDGRSAAILWQAAKLNDLRIRARGRNDELYSILLDVYRTSLEWSDSVNGKGQGNPAESEDRSKWTTPEAIAKTLRVTPRTVRNDISRGRLPAVKNGRAWVIESSEADTYIAARAA